MGSSINVNLGKLSRFVEIALPLSFFGFLMAGYYSSFYFHFLTITLFLATTIDLYYRRIQRHHALLANFGWVAQGRYLLESIGPELRQYLFATDTEERPFTRVERSDVYRKAKGIDASSAFGSLLEFDGTEYKLRHSLYPVDRTDIEPFSLTFGEERQIDSSFTITKPIIISAMSYGALGSHAVRALARGARKAGIPQNTGEGGFPKYHLMEGCDLIFQMGTAKFGVRNEDGSLDAEKLHELAAREPVRMVEIKFSQGAKPGTGGLLPKEKITREISDLRGVPMGQDVVSPPRHVECTDAESTVRFIRRIQDISQLPVGIKMCLGRDDEFRQLVRTMKRLEIFPDYISIDGAEGGTGAAPRAFMDDLGVPILEALPLAQQILIEEGIRDQLKLIAAGKLINAGKHILALSMGAQACYSARGFMLALGCIQALTCNKNTCPAGITTHDRHLQRGLDIEVKSERVKNYVLRLEHDFYELLGALGKRSCATLDGHNVLFPASGSR